MGFFGRKKHNAAAHAAAAAANERTPEQIMAAYKPAPRQYVELGTINYSNLTPDGRHGDYQTVVDLAAETGKPIFANFVEWSG